ncbi:MAG: SDR family NAD(P)-dependent oxidoreductase [Novosphingobium sp.]|nr:SDR family NAD(P)-dependent oxidoreductase [Novosphingobium sp.]
MAEGRLEGKVAIVTGAGHGIGRCEAMSLGAEGASVVVSDFGSSADGAKLAELVSQEIVAAGGRAVAATEDLSCEDGARKTVVTAIEAFGGLDILVNNAGMRGGNPVDKLTDQQWDLVLGTHLKATFLTIKFAVPHLRRRGGGSIVNTGSEAGLGMVFNSAYSAAKEGVAGLTRSIAREQGRFNIRCNMIRPRATAGAVGGGDWFQKNLAGTWKPLLDLLGQYWIGERGHARWEKAATPASIAAFVTWLCTPAAGNINGQDFFVGGDEVALLTPPTFAASLFRDGDWTLEALDELAPTLTGAMVDNFKVANPFADEDV